MATIKRTKPTAAAPAPAIKPEPYLYLQAWNLFLRGPRMFNVEQAREENAPVNATFKAFDGHWATVDGLHEGHPFREYAEKFIKDNT